MLRAWGRGTKSSLTWWRLRQSTYLKPLTQRLIDWLSGWFVNWLNEWLMNWMIDFFYLFESSTSTPDYTNSVIRPQVVYSGVLLLGWSKVCILHSYKKVFQKCSAAVPIVKPFWFQRVLPGTNRDSSKGSPTETAEDPFLVLDFTFF